MNVNIKFKGKAISCRIALMPIEMIYKSLFIQKLQKDIDEGCHETLNIVRSRARFRSVKGTSSNVAKGSQKVRYMLLMSMR